MSSVKVKYFAMSDVNFKIRVSSVELRYIQFIFKRSKRKKMEGSREDGVKCRREQGA